MILDERGKPSVDRTAEGCFEGQVGAAYLLAMLVAAEPRDLPGTTIDRVASKDPPRDFRWMMSSSTRTTL